MLKFLKKIFGLNGRLDRKGYLLLGVLPMVVFGFLVPLIIDYQIYFIILLILFVPILIIALVSAVKRGRDSGLNGLVTLFLFGAVPMMVVVLNVQVEIDIFYVAFSFIAYLILMPSSSKELKLIGKIEYVFTVVFTTLVFLLVILALIAPKTCITTQKMWIDLVCVNMRSNANVLKMFKLDNGIYPSTEEGNAALVSNPNALKYPNYAEDGYLKRLPKDSWAGKLIYVKTKDGFELISYGADRKEGGEDEYADIFYSECK
jgi:general secretion pathway protein G